MIKDFLAKLAERVYPNSAVSDLLKCARSVGEKQVCLENIVRAVTGHKKDTFPPPPVNTRYTQTDSIQYNRIDS